MFHQSSREFGFNCEHVRGSALFVVSLRIRSLYFEPADSCYLVLQRVRFLRLSRLNGNFYLIDELSFRCCRILILRLCQRESFEDKISVFNECGSCRILSVSSVPLRRKMKFLVLLFASCLLASANAQVRCRNPGSVHIPPSPCCDQVENQGLSSRRSVSE